MTLARWDPTLYVNVLIIQNDVVVFINGDVWVDVMGPLRLSKKTHLVSEWVGVRSKGGTHCLIGDEWVLGFR